MRRGIAEDVDITLRPGIPVDIQVVLEGPLPGARAFTWVKMTPTIEETADALGDPMEGRQGVL